MDEPLFYTTEEICKRYQISEATLYRLMQAGTFPKPSKLGARLNRWFRANIEEYDRKLIEEASK